VSAYPELEARFRRISVLRDGARVLNWDQSVMMPPGGAAARAEQIAALEVLLHELTTNPRMEELLDEAEAGRGGLDGWQDANLAEMRRRWRHANAVPADLVEAYSKACSASEKVWRKARPENDFAGMLPHLREVLRLTREVGAAKGAAFDCSAYEGLADLYEPDLRVAEIDPVFDDYAAFLPDFLDDVLARQAMATAPHPPEGPFPIAIQRELCRRMAEAVGIDFEAARLDETLHPFSGGVPEDSRITTRYEEDDFVQGMMGVLHESGHAMYEIGRPADWRYQPVGRARGMILHESQSLIVEMQVCRSPEFLGWAAPVIAEAFAKEGPAFEAENLYRLATRVERSLIRVDADEVTYPAHVILRYRLELAMIGDELDPAELPAAWNDGLEALLGIRPPDDRLGCLQDIHWYDGAWGYFPTYTLGAMAAAQLFQAASTADPEIVPGIAAGDFGPLMAWLRPNVHSLGCRYSTAQVLEAATGRPLDPGAFKAHLQERYLG